jgi:wyosine [tRNA(Phe)-imidazoG37] synthetase (radical SAM superfamily)
MDQKFKYLYGPVYSWRLGRSLGIDPISAEEKVCNFNCAYCQLGDTMVQTQERKVFVPTHEIIDEVQKLDSDMEIDYLTFSGRGEPTLAKNLGEMILGLKRCRKEKIAVITNAGLINDLDIRRDLSHADCVLAKLDAHDQHSFNAVDRPCSDTKFSDIVEGLRVFAQEFKGKLALQMMFIEANKSSAPHMARIAAMISADEIELNTPLRPCGVLPLSEEEMIKIKGFFKGLAGVTMVYERERKNIHAIDMEQAKKRHGNY